LLTGRDEELDVTSCFSEKYLSRCTSVILVAVPILIMVDL